MAELTAAPTASDAGQNSASAAPGSGTPAAGEQTFTQAQLEAAIKDRLDRQKRAIEADAAKARKEQEDAALAEKGEHKERADRLAAELSDLKAQLAARDLRELRRTVAKAAGIEEFADRLQGTTEAELQADAATFAAAIPKAPIKPPPPGLPGGPPPAGPLSRAQQLDAEKQAARASGRFGF